MLEKLAALNKISNDLLRKAALIIVVLGLIATLSFLFPYIAPFAIAALIAAAIEPLVRLISSLFKRVRFRRGIASGVSTILVVAILLFAALVLSTRIISELTSVAYALPRLVSDWVAQATAWFETNLPELELLDESTKAYIRDAFISLGKTITSSTTTFASSIARGVWNTATVTVPQILLFVTLTFMSTFYFSADRERIILFLTNIVPSPLKKSGALVKANLFRGLFSQLRATLIMLLVTFVELSIGFSIIGVDYVLLLALVISVLDALPILGTGLFLLPMSIYGFVVGDYKMGVSIILLYLIIGIVRQMLEPRIIGRNMGLHPLATMMAMYASYKIMGLGGMILGPMILLLCKVIIGLSTAPSAVDEPAAAPDDSPPLAAQRQSVPKSRSIPAYSNINEPHAARSAIASEPSLKHNNSGRKGVGGKSKRKYNI
ncbi:MAG: sporulation integral membrane protein YtvI [Oscillospiraceae bacterium]|jgi:sporulation integral membrane protein YtvI|nr:sporulation integral membrane protein YtvI [Oscillospiraceae bacterium]